MKFSSLFVVFTSLLLTVVSAARYPAILKFLPSPRIFPPPYFTVIDLPTIEQSIRVNLWQLGSPQDLTQAYPGQLSRGYVEVDDLSAFDGRYAGLVNDDTENLEVKIHRDDGKMFTFIGQSATEETVTNMKVRADVIPQDDVDLWSWW
ncbi:hypothetical protein O0I10_011231 [Lichtheimia ornata]|uniref:Uncharacterized protein n=1 Tax=Lichtheimia ornata TaxID=688661 RepID=A0AAD7XST5_9FUNG|nr:uncharacterized protein O0I10_011231 [Lichtheimia ornata]KAJ8653090.1 hypothetical protein O0I10_011231 [Lichtheimia ornata]